MPRAFWYNTFCVEVVLNRMANWLHSGDAVGLGVLRLLLFTKNVFFYGDENNECEVT